MLSRRHFIGGGLALGALPTFAATDDAAMRTIPSSRELIPVVGLGSWVTFNVGRDPALLARSTKVIETFLNAGGGMIDSSPMYGSAQDTIGHALRTLKDRAGLFATDKVWTDADEGVQQILETRRRWGVDRFDLLQVHNLWDWEAHLDTLFAMKDSGDLRYVGVTTSHGRRHGDLFEIMREQPIDFVQLTLNAVDREAEQRLLPLALEKGIAVVVNRPFRRHGLIHHTEGAPLPGFAADVGATSWAQLLLKFVLAHPAVTTVIPATTSTDHVVENKQAAMGRMPDDALRDRISQAVRAL